jgi:ATP-dependent helicase/nuclease subunit A
LPQRLADGDWVGLATDGLIGKVIGSESGYAKVQFTAAHLAVLQPLADHVRASLVAELAARNSATRELLVRFDAAYAAARARAGAVRFDDVARLLDERGVTADLPELLHRLGSGGTDGGIEHVLLDEFQDTSARQWRLLLPVVDALFGGVGRGRSFFCVGDVKQSLYAWRNAEPALMGTLKDTWPTLAELPLTSSWRSAPQIIQALNAVFTGIVANPVLAGRTPLAEGAAEFAEWFKPHDTHQNHVGYCRLITCADTEEATDPDAVALDRVAERASKLHHAYPTAKVAVLSRRTKFIPLLLERFRKAGVTATGEGGSPLADDAAVCAVLSLLHLAGHPGDSAARYHVAQSPLGRVVSIHRGTDRDADRSALSAVRLAVADDGLAVTIDGWRRALAGDCDDRNAGRLAQLVELAHEFDAADGLLDLDRFAAAIRVRRVADRRPAPVLVMTVHAAKGREFDYVVLADLDRNLLGDLPPVLFRRPTILADADCITVAPGKDAAAVDARLADIDAKARRKLAVEELCGLYVAMTRAKTGLEMVCQSAQLTKDGRLPASAGGLLRGALLASVTDVDPETELWGVGEMPPPDAASTIERSAAAEPLRLTVEPAGPASRTRPAVAPSSLEGDGWARLGVGTVLHRWFEQVEWLDDFTPNDDTLRRAATDLAVPADRLAGLLLQFRRSCGRPQIAAVLARRGRHGLRVWSERPFTVRISLKEGAPPTPVRGMFDRLVVDAAAGTAELIDFKTDTVEDDAAVGRLVTHYAPQLLAYRLAVAQLFSLPPTHVAAKLAFVGSGHVVDVSVEGITT